MSCSRFSLLSFFIVLLIFTLKFGFAFLYNPTFSITEQVFPPAEIPSDHQSKINDNDQLTRQIKSMDNVASEKSHNLEEEIVTEMKRGIQDSQVTMVSQQIEEEKSMQNPETFSYWFNGKIGFKKT